ncbi:hypothetical protein AB0E96_02155 [Kitasatospora sp. NPDC036755]
MFDFGGDGAPGPPIGTADTPEEGVALLVEHLPPDLGPVLDHPPEATR